MFQITDVNVLLAPANGDGVLAYVAITVDGGLVVRDLKIVNGPQDVLVVFPSRKLTDHCPNCDGKNHLRARYCNDCGHRLDPDCVFPASRRHR
jgi:stage V sporulation protein G